MRRTELQRKSRPKRSAVSSCSSEQRAKVKRRHCLVCGDEFPDPAHLIDKAMAGDWNGDERAVVPLCREHHRLYDTGELDLLPNLEPAYRKEVAFAVERVGLITALQRITNERWAPEPDEAAKGSPAYLREVA